MEGRRQRRPPPACSGLECGGPALWGQEPLAPCALPIPLLGLLVIKTLLEGSWIDCPPTITGPQVLALWGSHPAGNSPQAQVTHI